MQPKWTIDKLMSTREKRKSAMSTVRSLLEDYDDIEINPEFSNHGEEGASEAKQSKLLDKSKSSECQYGNIDS